MTSKLNGELVSKAVDDILAYSAGETIKKGETEIVGKKRKFTESIELQVRSMAALREKHEGACLLRRMYYGYHPFMDSMGLSHSLYVL